MCIYIVYIRPVVLTTENIKSILILFIFIVVIILNQPPQVIENFAIRIFFTKAVIISVFVCLASSVGSSRKKINHPIKPETQVIIIIGIC